MKKTKKNKHLTKKGGSTIYDIDKYETRKTDDTYNGEHFFRKIYPKKISKDDTRRIEKQIVEILMSHPHPNIVTYYDANDRYIDMEELDSPQTNENFLNEHTVQEQEIQEIIHTMREVKHFLQSLGIMYIDWKFDNIAKSKDGNYKLYDFDGSGIAELNTNRWIIKPPNYWSFKNAEKNGCKTPKEIDDWSFEYNILGNENVKCSLKIK